MMFIHAHVTEFHRFYSGQIRKADSTVSIDAKENMTHGILWTLVQGIISGPPAEKDLRRE
jgi:hypothetical protein